MKTMKDAATKVVTAHRHQHQHADQTATRHYAASRIQRRGPNK